MNNYTIHSIPLFLTPNQFVEMNAQQLIEKAQLVVIRNSDQCDITKQITLNTTMVDLQDLNQPQKLPILILPEGQEQPLRIGYLELTLMDNEVDTTLDTNLINQEDGVGYDNYSYGNNIGTGTYQTIFSNQSQYAVQADPVKISSQKFQKIDNRKLFKLANLKVFEKDSHNDVTQQVLADTSSIDLKLYKSQQQIPLWIQVDNLHRQKIGDLEITLTRDHHITRIIKYIIIIIIILSGWVLGDSLYQAHINNQNDLNNQHQSSQISHQGNQIIQHGKQLVKDAQAIKQLQDQLSNFKQAVKEYKQTQNKQAFNASLSQIQQSINQIQQQDASQNQSLNNKLNSINNALTQLIQANPQEANEMLNKLPLNL